MKRKSIVLLLFLCLFILFIGYKNIAETNDIKLCNEEIDEQSTACIDTNDNADLDNISWLDFKYVIEKDEYPFIWEYYDYEITESKKLNENSEPYFWIAEYDLNNDGNNEYLVQLISVYTTNNKDETHLNIFQYEEKLRSISDIRVNFNGEVGILENIDQEWHSIFLHSTFANNFFQVHWKDGKYIVLN